MNKKVEKIGKKVDEKKPQILKKESTFKKKKKIKRNITSGIAYVYSTFNNTIISIADESGNVVSWSSAGSKGFKGSRKSTPYAAQVAADDAGSKAYEQGLRTLTVQVKGPGSGRETALRSLQSKGFKILSIKEKPNKSKSNLAVTGLYFFDNRVINYSKSLKPSKRNELEIVDLLNKYRKKNNLNAEFLGRGGAWLDTGSIDDFYNTSAFVSALENRQGLKIACLEEIALKYNWINKKDINGAINFYGKCIYSNYLKKLIQ